MTVRKGYVLRGSIAMTTSVPRGRKRRVKLRAGTGSGRAASTDASISSKDLYAIYRMWCDENGLSPLKARSFSDAVVTHAGKYNLEHCNNVTNPAGRRVWGFMGIEAVARPDINSFCGDSLRTYVPDEWEK